MLFCWFYDFVHNTFFTEYLQANVSACVFVVFVDFIYGVLADFQQVIVSVLLFLALFIN